jgi:hypothetical protein
VVEEQVMARSKVVFDDQGCTKRLDGEVEVSDSELVKITVDDGRVLWVNKNKILFIKELP